MATVVTGQTPSVERLTRLSDDPGRYDIPHEEILATQLEAADELFQSRLGKIRLLAKRAETGGISGIQAAEHIVPVLFAHTTYKSYPESWLVEKRWDRLTRWLDTVSSYPVENIDLDGVEDVDQWLDRLKVAGHLISCSSGTSGKSAMFNASALDIRFGGDDIVGSFAWGTGLPPQQDRRFFGIAPVAKVPRNDIFKSGLAAAYAEPGAPIFDFPVPPITIGQITGMVALRKAIADGVAQPEELARYEAISVERQATIDDASIASAEALVAARGNKLFITGMWAALHKVAEVVHAMGYSGKDFHPENSLYVGGGLKGVALPSDYRETICDTFNLRSPRVFSFYGMQELNSSFPKCSAGRYHAPPWVMTLLLDDSGDNLIAPQKYEQEGRAAFVDLSLDGRWNGVISGDKVSVDYQPCRCGARSPSIADTVARYADLAGGDKISCAGTIDAYVRGVA